MTPVRQRPAGPAIDPVTATTPPDSLRAELTEGCSPLEEDTSLLNPEKESNLAIRISRDLKRPKLETIRRRRPNPPVIAATVPRRYAAAQTAATNLDEDSLTAVRSDCGPRGSARKDPPRCLVACSSR